MTIIGFDQRRKAAAKPEKSATFVEPATSRSIQDWTPQLIKAARASADAGNLQLAADFCESAMADDRVSAALQTRTNGLVALPLSFEAGRGQKRLVKALEAGEDWWASYPATVLAELLRWGIMLGVGLAKQTWVQRGSNIDRLVPKIEIWNPRHLRWDWQRRRWMLKVDGGREIEITPGDGTWILFQPYGENRPWVHGAWRAISYWHLLKTYAIEDWGYYSSKNAGGHLVVEQTGDERNTGKEKRKELAADLFAAQANSAIVLPPGFTLRLVESTADTWQTFEAQKNAADLGQSVAILGQNLSTEVTGPVATGMTLHGRVLQSFINFDGESLPTCVHDQSLVWWAEFNFGARDICPWPVYDTKPPEDRKANAEVSKQRAETGKTLASIGVFTVNEVRVAAGHEPLDEGGDEIVKPAPPPTPAEPGSDDAQKALSIEGLIGDERKAEWRAEQAAERRAKRTQRILRDFQKENRHRFRDLRSLISAAVANGEAQAAAIFQFQKAVQDGLQDLETRASVDAQYRERAIRLHTEANERLTGIQTNLATLLEHETDSRRRADAIQRTVTETNKLANELLLVANHVEGASVRLRSGRAASTSSGLVQGQLYADAVADAARERAAKALDDDVAVVLEAIDAGETYDDVRKRLVNAYTNMNHDKLAKTTEAAITMAELGGRHAVNEDA
jgi:phage gp29-like protein